MILETTAGLKNYICFFLIHGHSSFCGQSEQLCFRETRGRTIYELITKAAVKIKTDQDQALIREYIPAAAGIIQSITITGICR